MQIYGHNMTQNLIDLNNFDGCGRINGDKNIRIDGLISSHNFWRYNRDKILFFVNGRWVKNTNLIRALMKGYKNVLPPLRFPVAFLFINLDKDLVDINVHPRKEEVRFAKPVTVSNLLHQLVTKAPEETNSLNEPEVLSFNKSYTQNVNLKETHPIMEVNNSYDNNIKKIGVGLEQNTTVENKSNSKIIGQILNTYIVVENDDGLVLIDQHAAHERILYEKFLKNFEQKDGTRLLFPEIIKLNNNQLKIVLSQKDFLSQQGIEVEQIGQSELAIKTSPPKIQNTSIKELVFEMIEFVNQNESLEKESFRKKLNEHMHSQMACKMAMKAGDILSQEMMINIVTQLQQVDNRFICVHGRPTIWTVYKDEIEKKFRRK
jgi:DNA mismatch repair protein MutL